MSLPGKQIETNGLRFHVAEEGTGPAVLLLHGFPDSSSLWRYERLEGTSHWLQLDQPEWLNKVLIEFIKKPAL